MKNSQQILCLDVGVERARHNHIIAGRHIASLGHRSLLTVGARAVNQPELLLLEPGSLHYMSAQLVLWDAARYRIQMKLDPVERIGVRSIALISHPSRVRLHQAYNDRAQVVRRVRRDQLGWLVDLYQVLRIQPVGVGRATARVILT